MVEYVRGRGGTCEVSRDERARVSPVTHYEKENYLKVRTAVFKYITPPYSKGSVRWYVGTLVRWYVGTLVRWYVGTSVRRYITFLCSHVLTY